MNRLADETSPYLLQHAGNPVDWYPWGEEALERAKAEDKPIFLSVGYSACHWCHVMERESFANPATAELMNENFVNVKVDREERPDVDALYMEAAVAINRSAAAGRSACSSRPTGKPFWAGDLPARRCRGTACGASRTSSRRSPAPGATSATSWRRLADSLTEHLRNTDRGRADRRAGRRGPRHAGDREPDLRLRLGVGRVGGGTEVPACAGARVPDAPRACRGCRRRTLDAMAAGGMYDLVGGGFHRYSVDQKWLVPHFEKMLYDNAQLAVTYLHGWQTIGKARYRQVVEQTLGYMLRELAARGRRLRLVSGRRHRRQGGADVHVDTLRRRSRTRCSTRSRAGGSSSAASSTRPRGPSSSRCARQRPKPARDDKAVASWNGLALAALAECGRVLDRADWVDAARALGEFLLGPMSDDRGRLHRTWRDGVAKGTGYLEDYADVANGLLELHAATGELRWLEEANRLARLAVELFDDAEERRLLPDARATARSSSCAGRCFDDSPAPSGNSMLAYVLLRLSRIYGDDELEEKAPRVFRLTLGGLQNAGSSFGWGLVGVDLYLSPRREIAIVGPPSSDVARKALRALGSRTR